MIAGREIPGFKLVEGRSLRTWKDQMTALHELEAFGLGEDDLYAKKFVSPAQAEKTLKGKKVSAKLIEHLITKPPGKTTFAPESDSRLAVKPDATTDFFKVA